MTIKGILSFIQLIRWFNLCIIIFTQYAIHCLIVLPFLTKITTGIPLKPSIGLNPFDFFLLSLSTVMIAAGGNIINDYFDTRADRINKPDQLIVGRSIKRRVAMGAHVVINIIALGIATHLCTKLDMFRFSGLFYAIAVGLWYYATHFKHIGIVGNMLIAFFVAMVPFIAGIFDLHYFLIDSPYFIFKDVRPVWFYVLGFSLFAFLITLAREMVKDIIDIKGDKRVGSKTLAIKIGIKKTKKWINATHFLVVLLLIMVQSFFLPFNAILIGQELIIVLLLLFAIVKTLQLVNPKDFKMVSTLNKIASLVGICLAFTFYYLNTIG